MSAKRSNGEGGVPRQRKDGRWAAEITVADPQTGLPRRKTIYGASKALCSANVQAAIIEREAGTLVVGKSMKLGDWLEWWLENEVAPKRKPLTYRSHRSKMRLYVQGTALANMPLNKVSPAHLQGLWTSMAKRGLSASTIRQTSAILSRALKVAVHHGHLGSNPADRMDSPEAGDFKPQLLKGDDAKVLIAAAAELDPEEEALWLTFLSLGLRMGEVLGLSWDLVDLDAGTVVIGQGLIVVDWEHGCPEENGEPSCGRKKGGWCPQRHGGGARIDTPKTDAGERTIPLPALLVDALRRHRAARDEWPVWTDVKGQKFSLVFPSRGCLRREAVGQPMDQSLVNKRWKAFLAANGVAPVRPHDARHTAATTLMVMGVPDGVVMKMMGWSQRSMLTRYQHAPDSAMREAMAKVQEFYAAAPPSAPQPEPDVVSLADFRRRRSS